MRPTALLRSEKPAAVVLVGHAGASAAAAFVTVDAKGMLELARNSVSGGTFTASVPLRAGETTLPLNGEAVRLNIPAEAACTVSATIAPSAEGLKPTRVKLLFNQPIQVLNPGSLIGAEKANEAATVHVTEIGFDATGQMSVEGSFKPNLGSFSRFVPAIPLSTLANRFLKKYDLSLEAFLKPRAQSVPAPATSSSKLDPKKLIAAMSAMIEKTSFDLRIDGPKDAHGSFSVHGDLDSPERGTLTGRVTGGFEGNLRVSVELAGKDNTPNGALFVTHKEDRLVLETGQMELGRALARQLGAVAGDRLSVDTALSATLAHSISIAIGPEGSLGVTLTQLGASLALKNASMTSPRFNLKLADPSSVTLDAELIRLGAQGLEIGKVGASVGLKVGQGELAIGGGRARVKDGALDAAASHDPEHGDSASFRYDIPAEGDLPGNRKRGRLRGSFELDLD